MRIACENCGYKSCQCFGVPENPFKSRFTVAQRTEIHAWRRVVALLKKTGAVTQADCESPATAPMKTDGQRLFEAIAEWGKAHSRMKNGGTMKTIIAIAVLLLAPLSARAWEFPRNPDRFPSVGFAVTNSNENGTRYESDGPYPALTRTQSGPEHFGGHTIGGDVRLPASDCLTFGFSYEHIESLHTFDRHGGDYQPTGVLYSEKLSTSGYRYGVTARLYFSK
jgi:hypothetical protein